MVTQSSIVTMTLHSYRKERKKLEEKLKELEGQASMTPTPLELAQKYLRELPPMTQTERMASQTTPYYATTSLPSQENAQPQTGVRAPTGMMSKEDKVQLYKQRLTERGPSRSEKVKRYMQSLSERSQEHQRSKDTANESVLSRGMRGSAVTEGPTTDQGLFAQSLSGMGRFEDVTMNSSGPLSITDSVQGLSLSTSFPKDPFSISQQQQPDRSPTGYSGKSGATDRSYGSGGMSSYPSLDIDARHAALKAQLSDIQRQKTDIQQRQQRHQDEMQQLKERWQQELDQYRLMDSLTSDRDFSRAAGFSQGVADAGMRLEQFPNQPYEHLPSEEVLEEELLSQLNDQATDHKYKIQRRKPGAKVIKVPNKSPMMPHELSTIQEMETPATEKKVPTIPRPMNSTELSHYDSDRRPIARNLFTDRPPTFSAPSELPPFQVPAEQPTDLNLPQTPQQLSQHFTKEPSEGDVESIYRNDFAEPSSDTNWNVPTWVGLESKVLERPLPSIDRVLEVERLPHETPGELVIPIGAPLLPTQDFTDMQTTSEGMFAGEKTC